MKLCKLCNILKLDMDDLGEILDLLWSSHYGMSPHDKALSKKLEYIYKEMKKADES